MNDFDTEQFEAELKSLQPSRPPQKLLDAVVAQVQRQSKLHHRVPRRSPGLFSSNLLKWLAPATALVLAAVLILSLRPRGQLNNGDLARGAATAAAQPGQVEIDRQLVANFDAVGHLPTGEPIRFRCEQWMDKVLVCDAASGVVFEKTTPRLEIVPVGFETY